LHREGVDARGVGQVEWTDGLTSIGGDGEAEELGGAVAHGARPKAEGVHVVGLGQFNLDPGVVAVPVGGSCGTGLAVNGIVRAPSAVVGPAAPVAQDSLPVLLCVQMLIKFCPPCHVFEHSHHQRGSRSVD